MPEKKISSQFYKKPEKVEEFYKKPESHEELVERMRILKEIPEDTSIPKVIIKLGSPAEEHKFDLMRDKEGRIYLIALPIEKYDRHYEIASLAEELYQRKLSVIGGGFIKGDIDKNEIIVGGSSADYGLVPMWKIKEILEQKFPTIKIKIEHGELIDDPKEILKLAKEGCIATVSLATKSALENSILSDKETFKKLISEDPELLKFALFTDKESFLEDKEVILAAMKKDASLALEFASEKLKDNKEFILELIKRKGGRWLGYASERLRDDEEVVLEAVNNDKVALIYASERLKKKLKLQ